MKTIIKHLIPNAGTLILVGLLFLAQSAGALPNAAPTDILAPSETLISYQGTLTDPAGNPLTATVTMKFALYDAATGGKGYPAGNGGHRGTGGTGRRSAGLLQPGHQ